MLPDRPVPYHPTVSTEKLHIARGGTELGLLNEAEIKELLRAGFLQPTDECWSDLDGERRPLSSFGVEAPETRGRWLEWVRVKAVAAGDTVREVGEKAGGLASRAVAVARNQRNIVPDATSRMLDDFVPRLRELAQKQLNEKLLTPTGQMLRDETFLRKLFGAIYDCLPKPIHRFVTDEAFIAYCLRNRQRFFDQTPPEPAAGRR